MKIRLTNTLSGKIEEFIPLDPKKVEMYVCGPTVYDNPHIGNARAIVVYDLLYNLFQEVYGKKSVVYVRNITDVDDKIIVRAAALGISLDELTEKVTKGFHEDCTYLKCQNPTFEPKATEHIDGMIDIISRLISSGSAYVSGGNVYYDVSKAKDYGRLSGRVLEELKQGSRVELNEEKKNFEDFVLWKSAKEGEPSYPSMWGNGRPGWHIECSAMSYKFLGVDFDIHGGGADLMFPHHTNEIAQSCSAFPGSNYAKYWVHNGFVTVSGEKMSKSLGNFITIRDIAERNVPGEALRMLLLNTHYRSPLDYSPKALNDIITNLDYLYRSLENYKELENIGFLNLPKEFQDYILGDLNTHSAFSYILALAGELNKAELNEASDKQKANIIYSCGRFLGILGESFESWFRDGVASGEVEELINLRKIAKESKNWPEADRIRQELLTKKILLEDKPDGSCVWRVDNRMVE